jgi:hypothetical protein
MKDFFMEIQHFLRIIKADVVVIYRHSRVFYQKKKDLYDKMKHGEIHEYRRVGFGDVYVLFLIRALQLKFLPDSDTLYGFFVIGFSLSKIHPFGLFIRTLVFMYLWSTHLVRYFVAICLRCENYVVRSGFTRFFFEMLVIFFVFLGDHPLFSSRIPLAVVCYTLSAFFLVYIRFRCQFVNSRFLKLHIQTPLSWDYIEDSMIQKMSEFHITARKLKGTFLSKFSKTYPYISGFGYLSKQYSSIPDPKPLGDIDKPEHTNAKYLNPYNVSSLIIGLIVQSLVFYKFILLYAADYSTATLGLEYINHLMETMSPENHLLCEQLQERAQLLREIQKQTPLSLVPFIEFLQTKRLRKLIFNTFQHTDLSVN